MRIISLLYLLSMSLFNAQAQQPIAVSNLHISNPQVVGSERFSVLFWDIYDATLIAEDGVWNKNKPFALSLTYLRKISGIDITNRSLEEMKRQGQVSEAQLDSWKAHMTKIFPNVEKGDHITGVVDSNKFTHFYSNKGFLGTVEDVSFTDSFFSIWLGENTAKPDFKLALINGAK